MTPSNEIPTPINATQRAIDYLDAVEVEPGRYAFRYANGYYVTASLDYYAPQMMRAAYPQLVLDRLAAHSVAMPIWWKPEKRFAWRCWVIEQWNEPNSLGHARKRDLGTFTDYDHDVRPLIERGAHSERITADLETGEEVQA